MQDDCEKLYEIFVDGFIEEAKGLIAKDEIERVLDDERTRFDNAKKYGVNPQRFIGNNIARYVKDAVRRSQPLFFVYYLLSIVTQFFYCLFFWVLVKCVFFYFTGVDDAFSSKMELSVSYVFIAGAIISNSAIQVYARNALLRPKKDVRKNIFIFSAAAYAAFAAAVLFSGAAAYFDKFVFALDFTLMEAFLSAVAALFLSGIHNVAYSSHFSAFISIAAAVVLRRDEDKKKAIKHYELLSFSNFLTSRGVDFDVSDYSVKDDRLSDDLKDGFRQSFRLKIISMRAYFAIGFFIMFILSAICIRQLAVSGISAGFAAFSAVSVIICALLLILVFACNAVLNDI